MSKTAKVTLGLVLTGAMFSTASFKMMLLTTGWHYMLQSVAKGVDVYDEMLHYPWLLQLTKSAASD